MKKNNNKYRRMQTNSYLRHGRTSNTVNTTEETANTTNISTSQQNHQHQKPITLKHKAERQSNNRRHRKRHAHEDSKQRDVRAANFYMDVEHEPLPQPLQQRMTFDDSIYEDDDDDDDDDDDEYNPTQQQQQSPVINIDRSFHIDMDQPIKVLTLGGSNEAEKPEAAHKPHNAQNDDDDEDDDEDEEDNDDTYARANNNNNNPLSAINIISTPLDEFEIGLRDNGKKTTQSFTDFDALAPVSESSNRKTASSNSKMMPVLTPDGKVALLYREDEDTTVKNEHLNVTQSDNNKHNKNEGKQEDSAVLADDYDYDGEDDDEDVDVDEEEINARIMQKLNDAAKSNDGPAADVQKDAESAEEARVAAAQAPTSSSTTLLRPTDSILPMINRPLSEVLGIKKNQFKTFRIKDDATSSTSTSTTTSTTTTSTTTVPTPPAHVLASGIAVVPHELPKQHFIPAQTPLREFDFSHDSTMLDERSRDGKTQPPNTQDNEVLTPTDFIDLAMLPHIEQELTRLQQQEKRRHYHSKRNKHRPRTAEELSSIHFVMQIMMAIAAVSTVFGMLGTFFKQRILDQLRMLH